MDRAQLELLETLVRRFYNSHWTFDELSDEANDLDNAIRKLLDIQEVR
jgi:hypothetical protein